MDSTLKILQYFADAPVDEAKRAADLATLIVQGRRGEPCTTTQDPVQEPTQAPDQLPMLKPRKRQRHGTVRACTAQILRENGHPMPISKIRILLAQRFEINASLETIGSSISRLVKKGDEFTRPAKGLYGLVEWDQKSNTD